MRCPYCGNSRTEVLKTVYRGHNSYRHRRCAFCGSRFDTFLNSTTSYLAEHILFINPRSSAQSWVRLTFLSIRVFVQPFI